MRSDRAGLQHRAAGPSTSEALFEADFDPSRGELSETRASAAARVPARTLTVQVDGNIDGDACRERLRQSYARGDRAERRQSRIGRVMLVGNEALRERRIAVEARGVLGQVA